MKKIKLCLVAIVFFSFAAAAQQKCTTKETISCPAGADPSNASHVVEHCTKVVEKKCTSSEGSKRESSRCNRDNNSGSNNRSGNDRPGGMSRAADNGSRH